MAMKTIGLIAAVALAAGAVGGAAGAIIGSRVAAPEQAVAPSPGVVERIETYPAAPPEVEDQIEAAAVTEIDVSETHVYVDADLNLSFVVGVFNTDVETNVVGVWTMEDNIITGAANAAAAEQTDLRDDATKLADAPEAQELTEMVETVAGNPAAVPTQTEAPSTLVKAILNANWDTNTKDGEFMSGPLESAVVESGGRYYVALAFVLPEGTSHQHGVGVWVADSLDGSGLQCANFGTQMSYTPSLPMGEGLDEEAVSAALEAVGSFVMPHQPQQPTGD